VTKSIQLTESGFSRFIGEYDLCAVYYSAPDCNVCAVLKPKLFDLLGRRYPRLALGEVDCSAHKALAAGQSVFAIPTLIVYTDGREAFRHARGFSPAQVAEQLQRPYGIFLGD